MNTDGMDKNLKQLFDELRSQDASHTPPFDRVAGAASRDRAPAPPSAMPWAWLAAVAAALVLVGVSLTVLRLSARSRTDNFKQWAQLSQWQATTDVLLNVSPPAPWGTKITTLSDSWIDSISMPATTKANTKENQ